MTHPNDPNQGFPPPDPSEPQALVPPPSSQPYPQPYQQPYVQPQQYAQSPYQVAPKSPGIALLVSFFVPGVGSIINGDTGIGVLILVLYIVAIGLDITIIGALIGIPLGIGVWIWGMIHAYSGAKNWNARHGILS